MFKKGSIVTCTDDAPDALKRVCSRNPKGLRVVRAHKIPFSQHENLTLQALCLSDDDRPEIWSTDLYLKLYVEAEKAFDVPDAPVPERNRQNIEV